MPSQRPPIAILQPRDRATRNRIALYRKVLQIKLRVSSSWRYLRRGCLDLLGQDARHSTLTVGAHSRKFARRVCRETGMRPEEILAWLDGEGLGRGGDRPQR
jgi:hypothetical protein